MVFFFCLLPAEKSRMYFFCPSTSPFMKCSKSLSLSSVCCLLSPDTLPMNSKYSSAVRKSQPVYGCHCAYLEP